MCDVTDEHPPPFTTTHLVNHLRDEAQFVLDRGVVTRGQRLVIRDLLLRAAEEIEGHDTFTPDSYEPETP